MAVKCSTIANIFNNDNNIAENSCVLHLLCLVFVYNSFYNNVIGNCDCRRIYIAASDNENQCFHIRTWLITIKQNEILF